MPFHNTPTNVQQGLHALEMLKIKGFDYKGTPRNPLVTQAQRTLLNLVQNYDVLYSRGGEVFLEDASPERVNQVFCKAYDPKRTDLIEDLTERLAIMAEADHLDIPRLRDAYVDPNVPF